MSPCRRAAIQSSSSSTPVTGASAAATAGSLLGLQHPAARDVVRVALEQDARDRDDLDHARIGNRVAHPRMLPTGDDEAAPPQARQVVRHLRLRLADQLNEFANGPLTLGQKIEDLQPSRVPNARKYFASTSVDDGASESRNGASANAEVDSCNDIRTG